MTQFDISKIQSSSLTPGIQDLGTIPNIIYAFPGGSVPGSGHLDETVVIPLPNPAAMAQIMCNITGLGTNFNSLWFPLIGPCYVSSKTAAFLPFMLKVTSNAAGRQVNIEWYNSAVGAVNATACTFTFAGHVYNYPW